MLRLLLLAIIVSVAALSQVTSNVRGQVTDESGAVIPGAKILLTGTTNDGARVERTAIADASGQYLFDRLAAGTYALQGSSKDLVSAQASEIVVTNGAVRLDLKLSIKPRVENVTVEENAAPTVSTDTASNANGLVLRGEALDALSDNPDDLAADLQALAGPSAGPNGGAIYIDGFSGGDIPPKSSIREIRVNQDPFSPEFDKLGYGRIEIFTKPGTNKYHGTVDYNLGTDFWNSRNPYADAKAPLLLNEFEGGASGPLSKRGSFTLDAQRNMVDNGSIVNAEILDPVTLAQQPFNNVFKTLQRYTRVSPRVDYQLSENQTLSVRYGFIHGDINGAGIGGFDLISRGYHTTFTSQTMQGTYTVVHGTSLNETRFQYYRNANQMVANNSDPVTQVLGSFTGGGSQLGHSADTQNSFELQNYTSILHGTHAWKLGVRARALVDDSVAPVNFNGTYTFPSLDAYRLKNPSQFSISVGNPALTEHQLDFGFFAGDDWKVRPNFTVAYGARYEAQTNIGDWRDFSPRVSFAWAPDRSATKPGKTVVRMGFGVFYDRVALSNTLSADRFNGVNQLQYVIANPANYPLIPSAAELAQVSSPQVIERLAADLRAPYVMQSAVTIERQLSGSTTLAVTYTNSHGLHLLRSRDVNAPLNGMYPLGANKNPVMLIESSGLYNQNQMIANINTKFNRSVSVFGFYVLNRAKSNTDGVGTSPANPYDYRGEYGAAATDIHQRVTFGGALTGKWGVRLSPFMILQSGPPFNITSGNDTFDTTVFNQRPGIATNSALPNLVETKYGLLDPNPHAGEMILPRNYGRGPGQFTVNMRLSKTIGFGPEKGGPSSSAAPQLSSGQRQAAATGAMGMGRLFGSPSVSRRYNLILSMSARNLLNHNNPGAIIGNIQSPLFGRANQMFGTINGEGFSENASNRRLEMQIRFTF